MVVHMPDLDLVTIAEAAAELGKSRWTVWRLVRDGHIEATQPAGPNTLHVITRAELERYRTETPAA